MNNVNILDSEEALDRMLSQGFDDALEAVAAVIDPDAQGLAAEFQDERDCPAGGIIVKMKATGRSYYITWKFLGRAEEHLRRKRDRDRRISRALNDEE